MKKTAELVVVGSAASGLSCAVKAHQLGVRNILVLEKMPNTGGCSKFAGQINGFDTPVQKRQGLYYSADQAFKDVIHFYNWNCDAKLVRKWICGTGENIRWLEDELGVEFVGVNAMNDRPDVNRLTLHSVPQVPGSGKFTGYRIIEALLNYCENNGIEVLTKTPAKKLVKDNTTGAITGVIAEGPDNEKIEIETKAVMLATGSIGGSKDMIKRFYGDQGYEDLEIMSSFPHNTGDGIVMAEEIGAVAGRIHSVFIGPHNHFKGASEVVGAVTRRPHGIKLNKLGERFVDESLVSESEFGWMLSANLDRQPGRIGYTIIDKKLLDLMIEKRKEKIFCVDFGAIAANEIPTFGETEALPDEQDPTSWILLFEKHMKTEEQAGRAKVCNTLAEIAEYIGCDFTTLKETFDTYNLYCKNGHDHELLKAPEYLYALDSPPYYVLNGPSGMDSCIGGLNVNHHQQVLDKKGMPIKGLYAGGVLTSTWLNGLYTFFGSEMSYSVFSGRNAAKEVSEYIK